MELYLYKLQKYQNKLNTGYGSKDIYQQKIQYYNNLIGGKKQKVY